MQKKRFNFAILRNRKSEVKTNVLSGKVLLTSGFKPFLKTKVQGFHTSLFYDKINSKIPKYGIKTVSTHDLKEILKAKKLKPDYIFISPVFKTTSHPQAKNLGILRLFKALNQTSFKNFIILGGVSKSRYQKVKRLDFHSKIKGFAGISNI